MEINKTPNNLPITITEWATTAPTSFAGVVSAALSPMAPATTAQKAFLGTPVGLGTHLGRRHVAVDARVYAKARTKDIKINPSKQGVNSVANAPVRNNLLGVSKDMNRRGWKDAQGRKGKGYGVYRFANKYGTNVDGYSPIYTPDIWSETGNTYNLGTRGLVAWLALLAVGFAVGISLVVSTSAL